MRKIVFWIHLIAGLVAGLVIAIMTGTGAALAFQDELVAWAERDVRRVEVPDDAAAARLSLDELRRRVVEVHPELRAAGITVSASPEDAVVFSVGRDSAYYANPYTGAVRPPASTAMRDFMRVMEAWHRFLGRADAARPVGKAITGACNLAFVVLAVTGLYLWWPRSWSWRGFRAIALPAWRQNGKARDFNWHNSIGLWTAPVLIVLTLTAVPISYRWGSNLIYRMVGEEPPAQAGPGAGVPAAEITPPSPTTRPVGYDTVLAQIQAEHPDWQQITFRSGGAPRGQRPPRAQPQPGAAEPTAPSVEQRDAKSESRAAALTVTIREAGAWPRTAVTTVTLHPYSGEILRREAFGELSTGRQIRTWTRFLHTGQALGWAGQAVAGAACLGALLLVYTGIALAWRRFFPNRVGAVVDETRDQAAG